MEMKELVAMKDLEKFVSKKVLESYVDKFWLDQEKGRIGVTITNKAKE